ncbi:IclR family transcriptional regulator [Ruegeria sp. HKCCD8929]|uniref:IclR family transcriptional regulator n=1 Tax=Ruegeria sp. HKCCD8929 TaxID=2683006 RepID=UPI001488D1AF|nr:IclR family transcriptional regulator [Ruegeria sp. HKCCD8929]
MKTPIRQADRHVEAVLAALDVLECFLAKPGLSTNEIMQATGFTRNRVMRLTGTLTHRGCLMADPATGAFSIGPKIFALGKVFERNRLILSMVRPVLRDITLKTGESATFHVREGSERVVLAREEGTHAIRHATSEGQRKDLHTGAAGKVILAYSPEEVVETVLAKTGLPKRTATTITDKNRLLKELEIVRNQGKAISKGESESDVFAMAAPVLDNGQELVGALSISGPSSRFTRQIRKSCEEVLLADAMKLSRQLGWRQPGR